MKGQLAGINIIFTEHELVDQPTSEVKGFTNAVTLRVRPTKVKEDEKTQTAYWAGRLIGYDQAWEVAQEIVDEINEWRTCFNTERLLAESYKKDSQPTSEWKDDEQVLNRMDVYIRSKVYGKVKLLALPFLNYPIVIKEDQEMIVEINGEEWVRKPKEESTHWMDRVPPNPTIENFADLYVAVVKHIVPHDAIPHIKKAYIHGHKANISQPTEENQDHQL